MLQTIRSRFEFAAAEAIALAAVVLLSQFLLHSTVAAGTISGASGLIEVPSADVLADGAFEATVRFAGDKVGLSATYGAFDSMEVAVNTLRTGKDEAIGIVLKGVVYEETGPRPAVAIGLETGQSYAVLSKRIAPGVRLHAGYGIGRMQGLFAGFTYSLSTVSARGAAAPVTTLLGELTPNGVNVGARMVFSPVFAADIGLLDLREATAGLSVRLMF